MWGEQELANTIKDYSRKLLTVDMPPAELVPTLSVTMSQDAPANGSSQPQTKTKKKGGKGGGKAVKKAKGGVAKVAVKPEQSNKTAGCQKNEFLSLESIYTKWTTEGREVFSGIIILGLVM